MRHWLTDVLIPSLDTIHDGLAIMEGKRITKALRECEKVCSYARAVYEVMGGVEADQETLDKLDKLMYELMRMKLDGLGASMRTAKADDLLWQVVVAKHPEWHKRRENGKSLEYSGSQIAKVLSEEYGMKVDEKSIRNFRKNWKQ